MVEPSVPSFPGGHQPRRGRRTRNGGAPAAQRGRTTLRARRNGRTVPDNPETTAPTTDAASPTRTELQWRPVVNGNRNLISCRPSTPVGPPMRRRRADAPPVEGQAIAHEGSRPLPTACRRRTVTGPALRSSSPGGLADGRLRRLKRSAVGSLPGSGSPVGAATEMAAISPRPVACRPSGAAFTTSNACSMPRGSSRLLSPAYVDQCIVVGQCTPQRIDCEYVLVPQRGVEILQGFG
jgi:hypothetical protein